jgi:ferric-chelate reductase [NAD(P)H]
MNPKALHKISYGLYVVSAHRNGIINGQIANTVFQITSQPATLAVSINKNNYTHECIDTCGSFVVNVLDEDTPMTFIGRFGFRCGRDIEKFDGVKYRVSPLGNPILEEHSIAFLEAKVGKVIDADSHRIFIGELVDGDIISDGEPMTYAYYHLVKKGKSPKAAPTYIGE